MGNYIVYAVVHILSNLVRDLYLVREVYVVCLNLRLKIGWSRLDPDLKVSKSSVHCKLSMMY